MKKNRFFMPVAAVALSLMILSGCTKANTSSKNNSSSATADTALFLDTDNMFTDRDFEVGYDEITATKITISDNNSDIEINNAGTYIITGTTSDGSITVDVSDNDKVQIVLNGASVISKASAALYVKSADKVFVTTLKGTENTLANGGTFTAIDDNNIDGAIYSKSDITFNGEGTLTITSPAVHGIVGKDDVKFTSGTYKINCASHGVDANDSIRIANAEFDITSGKDGLHSGNDSEDDYIYIESGIINIKAADDGIHSSKYLTVCGGTLDIKAAEGLESTVIKINNGTINIEASDDGINAAKKSSGTTPTVEINGGKITIAMGQGDTDGIDSNGNLVINGGTINITANSPFDYDGTGTLNGGTVIVNGTEVTTLQNQMMGGGGMGNHPGGMKNSMGGIQPDNATIPAEPNEGQSKEQKGTMPQKPGGEMKEKTSMPGEENSTEAGGKRQKPGSKNSTANSNDTQTKENQNGITA